MKSTFRLTAPVKGGAEKEEKRALQFDAQFLSVAKNPHEYASPLSSLFLASDHAYHEHIRTVCASLGVIEHLVLVGIGGSSLGVEAVYNALKTNINPQLHVIDTIDSRDIEAVKNLFARTRSPQKIAVVIVSKSGGTIETMVGASLVIACGEKQYGKKFNSRVLCIGSKETPFLKNAELSGMCTLTIPDSVGGRYSVMSAVGIAPLCLLGIDTTAFLQGATHALSHSVRLQSRKHAASYVAHAKKNFSVVNFFPHHKSLGTLGLWYRQLSAESLGKEATLAGKKFDQYMVPVVSTLVELHSTAQLYLGGVSFVYTRFITAPLEGGDIVPKDLSLITHVPYIKSKSTSTILAHLSASVIKAYSKQSLSYSTTTLSGVSAFDIGIIMNSLMYETMCAGFLFNINPFDQPAVELYKTHFHSALKG